MLALVIGTALAQQLWEADALLRDMFPSSERLVEVSFAPDEAARRAAKDRLGARLARDRYAVWVATTHDSVDGYAVFDDEVGQHEPITFCTQVGADGRVVRIEVVAYREKYGDGIRDARFREQFRGRRPTDGYKVGRDVKIVSGATYSSRSAARVAQRAAVVVELFTASSGTQGD